MIELLVVIAIISLLVSILLPSLNRAKELARAVVCQSNLKQVGLATLYYAEDHGGYAPAFYTAPSVSWWVKDLQDGEYLDKSDVLVCPSWQPSAYVDYLTYGMRVKNIVADGAEHFNLFNTENETNIYNSMGGLSPNNFMLYADTISFYDHPSYYMKQIYWFCMEPDGTRKVHARHSERANSWFADGSVHPCSEQELVDCGVIEEQISIEE